MTFHILSIFGTRPEAIKMAPVIQAMEDTGDITSRVCITAQHRQMLDQVLELFDISADFDLDLMQPSQDLFDITSRSLLGIRNVLQQEKPDFVLVQGDTTTCFSGALAAFYENIPVGHVEAGLRTGNLRAPFPEELNRILTSRIANLHFAPTENARINLLAENIPEVTICVTGNTVIDALLAVRDKVNNYDSGIWVNTFGDQLYKELIDKDKKRILITGHRRENFGQRFKELCTAILELAQKYPDWIFIYPVHLNPNVRQPVYDILSHQKNIYLIEPLDYAPFVWLMDHCDLILTDSGGIQEEAPSLGKPVLVMRDVTERPEGVEVGTVLLVGTGKDKIIQNVENVMLNSDIYEKMSQSHNPYGDGKSAQRITEEICRYLNSA